MTMQQREAKTREPGTSQPAGGPDAPGSTPYPDIADTSQATVEAAAFFRSFFTAKTARDIEATQAHFHPEKTVYFDATLGWALPDNAAVRAMWQQYMPQWPAGAKSYPTRILGDMTSAVVFTTVAVGAAALELSPDGTITKFTVVSDGSLLDDRAITALAADAIDR